MFFATTSELFGQQMETPQNGMTPFFQRSPYSVSKLAGIWVVRTYREAYKLFMTNETLFNHIFKESGVEFVIRKIFRSVAKIYLG